MKLPMVTLLWAVSFLGCARGPVLDKQAMLDRQSWWDNEDWDWYRDNIPFFESPNPDIDATYYYRWEVLTKHLIYGSPETGYTFTEFIDRPFWSGAYGAISCPAGHQFYEVRWLKNRQIIDDFARYWFETPGAQPRSYSNWYGDGMWATYMVLGDRTFIESVLPHMETQYQGWVEERWDPEHEMFRWDGMHDGMETNINSRQTADSFMGADGYRPTLNSYLYADALAISQAALLLGDSAKAETFRQHAFALKERVQDELWDPARSFFFHQFANDEVSGVEAKSLTYQTGPFAGSPHGRELIGYVPWQFNLPDPEYEDAWQFLMNEDYFAAPFGPTTVEQNDPLFLTTTVCCVWSGNAWPYATTQTLVAMANLLNNYEQSVVDVNDYVSLLETYTMAQRQDGRPYIAEAADPYTGSWEGHNTFYHSEHYLHSAYVDLIITGLVGLRPRSDDILEVNPLIPQDWDYFALDDVLYKGRRVSIVWDRDGSRYGLSPGLTLLVDGREVANSKQVERLQVDIEPAIPVKQPHVVNYAVNNDGTYFPVIQASFSAPTNPPHFANDGNYWYHATPPNRWTTIGSVNSSEWLTIDFGVSRSVANVKAYFLDDGDVLPPAEYELQYWAEGVWEVIPSQQRTPGQPTGRRANVVSFAPLETSRIRIVLEPQINAFVGLTELETWGSAELPLSPPHEPVLNFAFDENGDGYPRTSSSFEAPSRPSSHVNDQIVAFTRYSRNRWSTVGSPNTQDWIELDFDEPVVVSQLDIYFYEDGERGVAAPDEYHVQYLNDTRWLTATPVTRSPTPPLGSARNRVVIEPVTTQRLRVLVEHRPGYRTAISEIMVWEDRR